MYVKKESIMRYWRVKDRDAADLKAKKKAHIPHDTLHGRNIALIFEKTSTRPGAALRWPPMTWVCR